MDKKINDLLIATAKGAVSVLPGGGILAEYIGLAQNNIADKRMNEWKAMVEDVLHRIPQSMNELSQNEEFYSCVQTATTGAMRAFQEEKRVLFASALYNSAIDTDLDIDKKLFYMGLLSNYTLSHVRLLQYFSENHYNQSDRVTQRGLVKVTKIGGTESPMVGITETLEEFKNDSEFVKHVAGQLMSDSLISVVDFNMPVSIETARSKRITPYGEAFLKFIKSTE